MNSYFYQIHHLVVGSGILLPELKVVENQPVDVFINEGNVPKTLKTGTYVKSGAIFPNHLYYELADDCLLLTIAKVGRVLIIDGRSITFERFEGVTDDTIRVYLLGTCLGFFLLWQEVFPFHGSTIQTDYGTAMFIGDSGEGKSTIAAKFMSEGHSVLTDDVCVVQLKEDGRAWAYPSIRRIKLWNDSVYALGYDELTCSPIMPNWEKKQLFLDSDGIEDSKPLTVIYKLSPDSTNQLKTETLMGHEKLSVLMNNTFRLMGVEILDKQKEHFNFCSAIARALPVKLLKRPTETFDIDKLYQFVMEDLKTISLEKSQAKFV